MAPLGGVVGGKMASGQESAEDSMNKLPQGCDQQGRYPEAAEAATDVGQEEEPNFYSSQMMLEETAKFALGVLVIFAVVGLIAALVGYFV